MITNKCITYKESVNTTTTHEEDLIYDVRGIDYNQLSKTVLSIAKEAGAEILEIYNKRDLGVTYKDDKSPLTLADKASNDIIEKRLKSITPTVPILSEEGKNVDYNEREKWNIFWLIDPLDGTKEFIKRNGEFTVNIALISSGQPIMRVVYAPVLDTIWYGAINQGSFKSIKDKSPIKINAVSPSSNSVVKVVTSRSHANNPKLHTFLEAFLKETVVK